MTESKIDSKESQKIPQPKGDLKLSRRVRWAIYMGGCVGGLLVGSLLSGLSNQEVPVIIASTPTPYPEATPIPPRRPESVATSTPSHEYPPTSTPLPDAITRMWATVEADIARKELASGTITPATATAVAERNWDKIRGACENYNTCF